MRKTSFGEMQALWLEEGKPRVEFLRFVSTGRNHSHGEHESFFVLRGRGSVYVGERKIDVKEGDLVTIPPSTGHWMETDSADAPLEGLLWYHREPLQTY